MVGEEVEEGEEGGDEAVAEAHPPDICSSVLTVLSLWCHWDLQPEWVLFSNLEIIRERKLADLSLAFLLDKERGSN